MSQTTLPIDTSLGRLDTLPGELRNQIYGYALASDGKIGFDCYQVKDGTLRFCHKRPRNGSSELALATFTSLSLTSRAIATESRPLFYDTNTFEITFVEAKQARDWRGRLEWRTVQYGVSRERIVMVPGWNWKTPFCAPGFAIECLAKTRKLEMRDTWVRGRAVWIRARGVGGGCGGWSGVVVDCRGRSSSWRRAGSWMRRSCWD